MSEKSYMEFATVHVKADPSLPWLDVKVKVEPETNDYVHATPELVHVKKEDPSEADLPAFPKAEVWSELEGEEEDGQTHLVDTLWSDIQAEYQSEPVDPVELLQIDKQELGDGCEWGAEPLLPVKKEEPLEMYKMGGDVDYVGGEEEGGRASVVRPDEEAMARLLGPTRPKTADSEKVHWCPHCDFKTKWAINLRRHVAYHNDCLTGKVTLHTCHLCGFTTKFAYSLKTHHKHIHDPNIEFIQCALCDYKTNRKSCLKRHFRNKHDPHATQYSCSACDYRTKDARYLASHFRRRHEDGGPGPEFVCTLCPFKAKERHYVTEHAKRRHADNPQIHTCDLCPFKTKVKRNLAKHVKRNHNVETAKTYQCPDCMYSSMSKYDYESHWRLRHDYTAPVFQCQHCDYSTKNGVDNLNRHVRLHHSDEAVVYRCDSCTFTTKIKKSLKDHHTTQHDRKAQRYHSTMEKNTDDSHEERKGKRQINDSSDDGKIEEERSRKNREKCKLYREKKKNEVAALSIGGSPDFLDKEREEERRKQRNTEKVRRCRENKRKKNETEVAALSTATADSSGHSSGTKMAQDRREQIKAEKCMGYSDEKGTLNLQTQNVSNRTNVPQLVRSSQIACSSTRVAPYVPPVIRTSQIARPSTRYVLFVTPIRPSSTVAGPSSRDAPCVPPSQPDDNSPAHSAEDGVSESHPPSQMDPAPPHVNPQTHSAFEQNSTAHREFEEDFVEKEFDLAFKFHSILEKDTDDCHEEGKSKRQINDSSDDGKVKEERNRKNREKCRRYREKKKNEVAALSIGGSPDFLDKEREEERKRKNREKIRRYRERKRNEVAALPVSGPSEPVDKETEEERKQRNREKCKRYRDKKRTSNLQTQNISNRKNVPGVTDA